MILAGDIGGTKTLLAAFEGETCVAKRRFESASYERFPELVGAFLDELRRAAREQRIETACFGIAGPVSGNRVRLTNLAWEIDGDDLGRRFGFRRVVLLNDFEAAARGIDELGAGDVTTLQEGVPDAARPRVVLGAGTGLGLALLAGSTVIDGEGGHASFAAADAEQAALAEWLRGRVGRVEIEHILSGAGLVRIHAFLGETRPDLGPAGRAAGKHEAGAITRRAFAENDPLALAALDLFLRCYGAAAGDYALTVRARGGVFVAGGIAPRLLPRIRQGGFLAAFNDKGTFSSITRACPVRVVTNTELGLLGARRHALAVAAEH